MWFRPAVFALLLTTAAGTAQAGNLDVNLASNAAAIDFTSQLTDSGLEGDIGYLHHTDVADIAAAGLDLVGNASPVGSPLLFGVGGKLFYVDPKDPNTSSGSAVGLGFHFRYTWPDYNRFGIGGELYYAPSIVSFQNVSRYLQTGVRAEYEVLRNADVYVGYRYISAGFTNGSQNGALTLDSSFVIGMSLTF
jgi:hypothetical protein